MKNSNFKVGDRVRIKTYTELLKENYHTEDEDILVSDDLFFTESMATLGGREATIKNIKEDGIVELIDWDVPTDTKWFNFHVNMLKPIKHYRDLTDLEKMIQLINTLQLDWDFFISSNYIVLYDKNNYTIATFDVNGKII